MARKKTGASEGETAAPEPEAVAGEPPTDEAGTPAGVDPDPSGSLPAPTEITDAVAEPDPVPRDEPEDIALLEAVDQAIGTAEPAPPFGRAEAIAEEAAPPTPDPAPEHHEEHATEESGPSFASRLLTALVLLLIGAGLALWGAPKLAPMLPAGMAPVAAWLTPGASVNDTRLAELESRLDADLAAVRSEVAGIASGPALDTKIGDAVTQAEARLAGEITGLRDQVGQIDGAEARQRLARVEAAVEGQVAELGTLKDQIAGGAVAAGGAAVAQIDVYRGELEGLRAEMGTLSDKVGGLGARIDEVATEADREIKTAQSKVDEIQTQASTAMDAATLEADLAQVRAAMADGLPFAEPLERLAADPAVKVPEALTNAAATGIASIAQLRDSFGDLAHAAIRASILAGANDGILGRGRALVEAQIATRSLSPREGQGPDAVLSRMEDKLRHDDIDGALAEAEQLPSEAAEAMSGWLDAARLRAGAEAGLATLNAELSATN